MYYVNKYVRDLYRVKFHDERGSVLRLDMNENPEGLPLDFVEKVKEKITPSFLAAYPEKDRLTALLAQHNGISADNISVTCGSDEAMRLIFQCFGEEGRQLLTVTPTFEMYGVYSNMFGMEHITAEYNDDFTLSPDKILSQISEKTGMVILLNPNSPIGVCWSADTAVRVIEKAAENGAVVIVDEAYHYFCESTFMPLIKKYDNLIVLRTFSKLYSCAGLRIGYAAGNETLIRYIENAESTFNVSSVAILFAEELMKDTELNRKLAGIEREGRIWLTEKLTEAGYEVFSGEGNYILFRPHRPSGELVRALKDMGVWVRDYSKGILAGQVRVSTGSTACMKSFFEALMKCDN